MPAVAGLLTGLSLYHMWFWLIWVALVPFFFVLPVRPLKHTLLRGGVFGVAQAGVLLFWIVPATQRYAGRPTLLGIPLFLLAVASMALFPAIFASVYSYLVSRTSFKSWPRFFAALCAGAAWIVVEWINVNTLPGLPWVKYTLAFSQARSVTGLQSAGLAGQWAISFFILIANLLFADAIRRKRLKPLWAGIAVIFLFYMSGSMLFSFSGGREQGRIKVAILQENIQAATRWQESNGDILADLFFDLNRRAAELNPDVVIWSETALPWTFTPDDDLVARALSITHATGAGHILGILSQGTAAPDKVYNSAYYIEPDGRARARYDKVELLSFLEKPLFDPKFKIPFLSRGLYDNALGGRDEKPLDTPHGKIGVLICNESLLPYRARKAVARGAVCLVNLSNDGWLEGTQLVDHHFYYARMRAVETGRSVITNSNRGIAGIIGAGGQIRKTSLSTHPACIGGLVPLYRHKTLYMRLGDFVVYLAMLWLLILLIRGRSVFKKAAS